MECMLSPTVCGVPPPMHRWLQEGAPDGGEPERGAGVGVALSWESSCPSCVTLGFICGFPVLPSVRLQHGGEVGDGGFTVFMLRALELIIIVLLIRTSLTLIQCCLCARRYTNVLIPHDVLILVV